MPEYRKHISELFGSGFFSEPVLDYFSRKHISELFGSVFFLGQFLDHFSRRNMFDDFMGPNMKIHGMGQHMTIYG